MPEIKVKHVVSFSSEDKVHKAENLLKDETYRKWKCATPGEKNATVVLQFEKAVKIHSIDIGNEGSAFVEVLVGRSSDSVSDYQVLLVASSFMSPLESRNGTHTNRVRMFGTEKLSQNAKDEKWDCVQIVCTQPFNKNLQYGLTFVKFHSPPEKIEELPRTEKNVSKLGAFKLKESSDSDDSLPALGSFFGKQKSKASESSPDSTANQASLSYATSVLNSSSSTSNGLSQESSLKRKVKDKIDASQEPPVKKTTVNNEHIVYKDVLRGSPESKKASDAIKKNKTDVPSPKTENKKKEMVSAAASSKQKDAPSPRIGEKKKESASNTASNQQTTNSTPTRTTRQKVPFNKIMDRVVFVLSGFVNPLRSDLREKALDMGAKYKADWDSTCTHLVCAFSNTPKYQQVKKVNGRIVSKEWIFDCYKKKEPILWRRYELSSNSSEDDDDSDKDPNFKADGDDEESDEDVIEEDADEESDEDFNEETDDDDDDDKKKRLRKAKKKKTVKNSDKKKPQSTNIKNKAVKNTGAASNNSLLTAPKRKMNISDSEDESSTPKKKSNLSILKTLKNVHQQDISGSSSSPSAIKDESETEDEDAIQDYVADTDVEDDSNGDTEDEIRKFEEKKQKKKPKMNGVNKNEYSEKPDVSDLPLPDLPDFFKKRRFYLYGNFSLSKLHELQRLITAYNGVLEDYMGDKVKYVITEKKWDSNFDDALNANEDLIFVKPTWIYKCHKAGKLIPYQPHIVIPDT